MNRQEVFKELEKIKQRIEELKADIGFGLNTPCIKGDLEFIADMLNDLNAKLSPSFHLLPIRGLKGYGLEED